MDANWLSWPNGLRVVVILYRRYGDSKSDFLSLFNGSFKVGLSLFFTLDLAPYYLDGLTYFKWF